MQKLINSELRYRRLFEAAQDGILILDAKTGMIEDVNPYLIKMLGYSRAEFIEKKLWEVGAFKDIEASKDAFEALQENEYIRYEDLPLKAKDGRLVQVEFVSNVYLVGDEKVIQCDIRENTEHKRTIAALQENEKKYHDLINQSPDGYFIIELSGNILTVNKAMCKELEFSEEEFLSMSIWDIIPEQYLDQYRQRLTKILKGESLKEEAEYEVRGKGGKTHYVEVLSAPRYSGKAIIGFQGIARDITARKRAEEALHESEELYRMLMETLPDGVIVHSQGLVVFANPASATIFGAASPAYLTGKPVLEFVHPSYRELALKRIQKSLSEGIPVPMAEEKFVRLDGTLIDVVVSAIPFSYAGKPAMLTVFNDITERKQAEESLKLAYSQLTNLYDNLPEALFSIDVVQGKALQVSPAFETVFGYSRDEFFKNPQLWYEMIVPEHKPIVDADYPVLLAGKILQEQFRILRPDGKTPWIEATIKPNLDENGKLVSFDGIASDITARKQAEERIQRQLEHLTALSAIDRTIATNINLELSLTTLLVHVIAQLHVDAAAVLLFEPDSLKLEYTATQGFRTKGIDHLQLPLLDGYSGHVVLDRQTIKIPNIKDLKEKVWLTAFLADDDFVSYYGVPLIAKGQVTGVLEVFQRAGLEPDTEWLEFLNTLAGQATLAIENAMLFKNLQRSNLELTQAYDDTIVGWSHALDLRDKETEGHTQRVTEMTMKLARHTFDLSEAELVQVRWGALLHDIGKMGVPDGILLKPGPLTDEEWVKMKMHPTFAYELLAPIRFLHLALDIPYCHHEKWDGTGYPRGLKGAQIPLVARIFAVVDVWDALSSDRPYRAAWPKEKVRQHILNSAGTHFDPQVVDIFMQLLKNN